jgi:hypothetical protein
LRVSRGQLCSGAESEGKSAGYGRGWIDPHEAEHEEKRIRLDAQGQTFAKIDVAFLAKQRKEAKSAVTLQRPNITSN